MDRTGRKYLLLSAFPFTLSFGANCSQIIAIQALLTRAFFSAYTMTKVTNNDNRYSTAPLVDSVFAKVRLPEVTMHCGYMSNQGTFVKDKWLPIWSPQRSSSAGEILLCTAFYAQHNEGINNALCGDYPLSPTPGMCIPCTRVGAIQLYGDIGVLWRPARARPGLSQRVRSLQVSRPSQSEEEVFIHILSFSLALALFLFPPPHLPLSQPRCPEVQGV